MSEHNEELEEIKKWDDFPINQDLLRGIFAYGLEAPSPIQSKAIIPLLNGKDIIGQAQSGTGKTATFCIGTLNRLNWNEKSSQAMIIAPTRELTIQISEVISSLSNFIPEFSYKVLVGGGPVQQDIDDLKKFPKVIIGCPGRICDMFRRKQINGNKLKMLILDEADEILSKGFIDQILNIIENIANPDLQIGVFSATMSDNISILAKQYMKNPLTISVKPESLTLEGIKQFYVPVDDDKMKFDTLLDIYSSLSVTQSIIYCNSVKRVIELKLSLDYENFSTSAIHSNMSKEERKKEFHNFKTGKSRILISTNVTARGIDIQQVGIVINFDLSKDIHTYLHRIGRSGRWGRKGLGINFITRRDIFKIKEIENYYQTQIDPLPSNFQVYI